MNKMCKLILCLMLLFCCSFTLYGCNNAKECGFEIYVNGIIVEKSSDSFNLKLQDKFEKLDLKIKIIYDNNSFDFYKLNDVGATVEKKNFNPNIAGVYQIKINYKDFNTCYFNVNVLQSETSMDPSFTKLSNTYYATYGQTLECIDLPNGWSFKDELSTLVGDVGTKYFDVLYTASSLNYKNKLTKLKIVVDPTDSIFDPLYQNIDEQFTITYGHTLSDISLPSGWKFEEDGETEIGDVGSHMFYVKYEPSCINYSRERKMISINVTKASFENDPEYSLLAITYYAEEGQVIGNVSLPLNWQFDDVLTTSVGNVGENLFNAKYIPSSNNFTETTGIVKIIVQ